MSRTRTVVAASAVAFALSGLGATAPDAAESAVGCQAVYTAVETVKVHATDDGVPPEDAADLARSPVVGQVAKGRGSCTNRIDGSVLGARYSVGGACSPGTNDQWTVIEFRGGKGWVPTSCGEVTER